MDVAKSYLTESAVRFPLVPETHGMAWRYLFDWTVAGQALNCRPGDRVLDFASGSGYVTELLNRLGYRTVALDLRPDILDCARGRFELDRRLTARWASFVSGDGQRLPFADATFDGVLCLNALHHMPDIKAALSEIRRVLRPGSRAVFSEPGIHHADSLESKMVVRQFGEIEQNICLGEIAEFAHAVGFSDVLLKPFVYPDLIELRYVDLEKYLRESRQATGDSLPRFCHFGEVAEFARDDHPIIVLTAPGSRVVDSAHPRLLRALIKPLAAIPESVAAGAEIAVPFEVTNTGDTIWLSQVRELGGYVTFGFKLSQPDGKLIDDGLQRTFLPFDIQPGQAVTLTARFTLPGVKPGPYLLSFDMVAEHITWFETAGSPVLHREIAVLDP